MTKKLLYLLCCIPIIILSGCSDDDDNAAGGGKGYAPSNINAVQFHFYNSSSKYIFSIVSNNGEVNATIPVGKIIATPEFFYEKTGDNTAECGINIRFQGAIINGGVSYNSHIYFTDLEFTSKSGGTCKHYDVVTDKLKATGTFRIE